MTREEAIKLIDTHTVCFYNEIDSPTLQALHLAIKALQADAVQGGDAEIPKNQSIMQQSRHDDGRMTREQAVKWVKFVHDVLYEDKDEEIREALDMAIEALSADAVGYETTATINEPISIQSNYVYVVRCKDCRYFKKIAERSDSGLCHRDLVASAWKENGYCSRGERREK